MRKESFEWEDDLREQKWSMERNTLLTYQRTTTFPIDNLPLPRANPSPGRQITNGMIRQAGYWLMGGHGMVAKALGSCKEAEVGPPFTNVGSDVFGSRDYLHAED